MWIHFDFIRDVSTQIELHKIFRLKISEWTKSELIDSAVLSYHFKPIRRPNDSLYLCLNIPSVKSPHNQNVLLTEETMNQIPQQISNEIRRIDAEYTTDSHMDRLETLNYEGELRINNAPRVYKNASIREILNFAAKGTHSALEILNSAKTNNKTWKTDEEIIGAINALVIGCLNSERERYYGLHFSCNSIFLAKIVESYLRKILNQHISGNDRYALDFLYEIEETGDIKRASRYLDPIVRALV